MRRLALALVPLVFLACGREPAAPDVGPRFAATHTTTNVIDLPFSAYLIADWGATCMPEEVYAEGFIHFMVIETITSNGNYVSRWKGQPQGLTGVGLTSGMTYHFTGATQETVTIQGDGFPLTDTYLDHGVVAGPGLGNNFKFSTIFKITINGVGDWVVAVDRSTVKCF